MVDLLLLSREHGLERVELAVRGALAAGCCAPLKNGHAPRRCDGDRRVGYERCHVPGVFRGAAGEGRAGERRTFKVLSAPAAGRIAAPSAAGSDARQRGPSSLSSSTRRRRGRAIVPGR